MHLREAGGRAGGRTDIITGRCCWWWWTPVAPCMRHTHKRQALALGWRQPRHGTPTPVVSVGQGKQVLAAPLAAAGRVVARPAAPRQDPTCRWYAGCHEARQDQQRDCCCSGARRVHAAQARGVALLGKGRCITRLRSSSWLDV